MDVSERVEIKKIEICVNDDPFLVVARGFAHVPKCKARELLGTLGYACGHIVHSIALGVEKGEREAREKVKAAMTPTCEKCAIEAVRSPRMDELEDLARKWEETAEVEMDSASEEHAWVRVCIAGLRELLSKQEED